MISLTSPVRTRAHEWPAKLKLAALALVTMGLYLIPELWQLGLVTLFVIGLYALPGREFFLGGMRRLAILWPFVAVLAIWHIATATYLDGVTFLLRLICAFGLANLVTMTTALTEMIEVIRWLATPLRRFGLNTRALELAIALVIRILPSLIDNGRRLVDAWRVRSHRRPGWRIVLPFTLNALDDADHLAEALRARGGLLESKES
ncbi:MAG: energy-coupling factor transporter transmembrane component T [Pseudomonadota bacterium]|nr:energy-coupling factor transporter transmembrane component T [Pseudomonadota bacterium]